MSKQLDNFLKTSIPASDRKVLTSIKTSVDRQIKSEMYFKDPRDLTIEQKLNILYKGTPQDSAKILFSIWLDVADPKSKLGLNQASSLLKFTKNSGNLVKSVQGLNATDKKLIENVLNKGTDKVIRNIFGKNASKDIKASDLREYAKSSGWTKTQTPNGPEKWVDKNGVARITIKGGSNRAPGSAGPHVEMKNSSGQRIDQFGNSVTRKSAGNHTPIIFD